MTENIRPVQEKSISSELEALLGKLTPNQLRYVVAAQDFPTVKEAAEAIDIKPDTVYRWPDYVKRAVELFAQDIVAGAVTIRRRSLAKAMAVKVAGLDSGDEGARQKVATEIIEWELGKATQRQELEGSLEVSSMTDQQITERVQQLLASAQSRRDGDDG